MKMDRIRNERIRGQTKVGQIRTKVRERRLKWCGHVMRRDEENVGKRVIRMYVDGRRRKGRPKRRGMKRKYGLEGEGTVMGGDVKPGCMEGTGGNIDTTSL